MKKKKKRLTIDINDELHGRIKEAAAKDRIFLKRWVTRALLKALDEKGLT